MKKTFTFLVTLLLSGISMAQLPTNGLIEHFTFDNTNIGVNGSVLNSDQMNYVSDMNNFGKAQQIDDEMYAFDTVNIANFPSDNSNRTIAFWTKHISNASIHSYFNVFNHDVAGSNGFAMSYEPGNGLIFSKITAGAFTGTTTSFATDLLWHHIAITFDGTTLKIYIDNSLALSNAYSFSSTTAGSIGKIGLSPGGVYYGNFLMDDFVVYNRALSAAEVTQLYNYTMTADVNDLNKFNFTIYPNPATTNVTLTNLPTAATIYVIDQTGRIVTTENATTQTQSISTNTLHSGIYFVQVTSKDGETSTQKLVIE